jgi:hypothetical protein
MFTTLGHTRHFLLYSSEKTKNLNNGFIVLSIQTRDCFCFQICENFWKTICSRVFHVIELFLALFFHFLVCFRTFFKKNSFLLATFSLVWYQMRHKKHDIWTCFKLLLDLFLSTIEWYPSLIVYKIIVLIPKWADFRQWISISTKIRAHSIAKKK